MAVYGMKNTAIFIGDAAPFLNRDLTAADFPVVAAPAWTRINGVATIGSLGDNAETGTFDDIALGRRIKFAGISDAGELELTLARDALDPGQIDLRAALANQDQNYDFQIVYNDRPNATGTPSRDLFIARVSRIISPGGGANDPLRRTVTLLVNSNVVEVAATAGA